MNERGWISLRPRDGLIFTEVCTHKKLVPIPGGAIAQPSGKEILGGGSIISLLALL